MRESREVDEVSCAYQNVEPGEVLEQTLLIHVERCCCPQIAFQWPRVGHSTYPVASGGVLSTYFVSLLY